MTPDVIDNALQARMKRKAVFERQNPPRIFFIVDEWAIRRLIGSPKIVIEAAGQGNLIVGTPSAANCAIRYDLLRGHAYSVAESRRVIRKAMESI